MAYETRKVDVGNINNIIDTIELLCDKIIKYTIKRDDGINGTREVIEFKPVEKNIIRLRICYKTNTNDNDSAATLSMYHRYAYVGDDLLCWVYIFSNRMIYSYLNGEFTGATRMLKDLTIDDI